MSNFSPFILPCSLRFFAPCATPWLLSVEMTPNGLALLSSRSPDLPLPSSNDSSPLTLRSHSYSRTPEDLAREQAEVAERKQQLDDIKASKAHDEVQHVRGSAVLCLKRELND